MITQAAFWGAIGAAIPILLALFAWNTAQERRQATFLTRKEHSDICDKQRETTEKALQSILTNIERMREEIGDRIDRSDDLTASRFDTAEDGRHKLRSAVNILVTRMAVIQQKLGITIDDRI